MRVRSLAHHSRRTRTYVSVGKVAVVRAVASIDDRSIGRAAATYGQKTMGPDGVEGLSEGAVSWNGRTCACAR
jgi:hypothetical protein